MSEVVGRDFEIKDSGGELIALGVTTKGFEITNAPIDITSDDSRGWQTFMSEPGEKSISMTIDGVFTDETLKAKARSSTNIMLEGATVNDGKTTLTGDWVIASYSNASEKDGSVMFSATLQSSGELTEVS
jgi:predicted secreted protein